MKTALDYMKMQVERYHLILQREKNRHAPLKMLRNIEAKISYYEAAVAALEVKNG